MGCNDYNLHLDSSEGNESPTPEFKIFLDGVGVNGYSPTVDIVNSTSSSFQIQVNDVDGTELTSPIPKLDYITNNYVSNTSLASTLADYSTTAQIASAYLKVDGSNASSDITINNMPIKTYAGSGSRLGNGGNLSALCIQSRDIRLQNYNTNNSLLASIQLSNGNVNIGGTAYYGGYEIATVDQIPTVGNGTITLTQGGVTKGSFTTNQSGNTTIALDAGGGSVTNPLEIVGEPYNDYGTQQKITIKAGTGNGSMNDIELGFKPTSSGGWITTSAYLISQINNPLSISNATGLGRILSLDYDSNTLDLNASNELTVKDMIGADGVNAGSAGLVPVPSATDNTKFLRGDGTWQTVGGGGGGSYTAGTGIDITNDVISVDDTVAMKTDIPSTTYMVTTNTEQTITANKVFDDSGILFYDEINSTNRNGITYNEGVGVYVGDTGERLLLQGKDIHPYYNNKSLALSSEIPDVSNFVTNSSLATTLASYVQSSSLATVATTGNYADLNGRPNLNAYVTIDTTQTISGTKTFSSETHHTGVITFDSAMLNPIIRGMSGSSYRNMIYRMGNDSAIIVGNSNDTIDLKGSGTRPTYNTNNLALYSDIPTVPTNISAFNNDSGYATQTWVGNQGYLTGITSTDVVNALGYTPYSSSNPNGYTSNVGTVTSVNNTSPDANGNVTISIPSISNLADKDLGNLSATGQAVIDGKADTSLSNITNTAKIAIAHNAMPSNTYTDLTLGASGSTYTAPADGYYLFDKEGLYGGEYALLTTSRNAQTIAQFEGSVPAAYFHLCWLIPIAKGDVLYTQYTLSGATTYFRFIYAVGSESEAQ